MRLISGVVYFFCSLVFVYCGINVWGLRLGIIVVCRVLSRGIFNYLRYCFRFRTTLCFGLVSRILCF